MLPFIDNRLGIKSLKKESSNRKSKNLPTQSVLDTSRLCLDCNNSVFIDNRFIETDGTSQGLHRLCQYSYISMAHFDNSPENYILNP